MIRERAEGPARRDDDEQHDQRFAGWQRHLAITPVRDPSGSWTSGRIETVQDNFGAPAGGQLEITASIQQPNVPGSAGLGYWPAFWTLGTQYRTDHNSPTPASLVSHLSAL